MTDAAFQEAQDASFSQLLLAAQLTKSDDAFAGEDFAPFEPCADTSVNAVVKAIVDDAQSPTTAVASTVATAASSAVAKPPPSATTTTQTQAKLPFKKRKSSGDFTASAKAAKKKPPSPATPSAAAAVVPLAPLNGPSTADVTPRGVEAALVIGTIAKRVKR